MRGARFLLWSMFGIVLFYLIVLFVFRWVPIPSSAFIYHQNALHKAQPNVYSAANYEWIDWKDIPSDVLVWSKKRILEVYLNVAQFAPVTFGVKAASKKIYDKLPMELSKEESAMLAAVLPTPAKSTALDPRMQLARPLHRLSRCQHLSAWQGYEKA